MTPETLCPVCLQDNGPDTGGCDCYGIPEPEPHYPSSADLAAFRKRIHDAEWSGLPQHREPCAWDAPTATAAEAREGIGATGNLDPYKRARLDGVAIHARREASAMRSRAFARVDGALKTDAWRREWAGIQELYAPRSRRPRTR